MKKFLNIKEVSNLLDLREHVIRYWDSIDPKTNKIRIEGISTKSKKGTRYFSRDNIDKLKHLKSLIYENGNHNHSLKLADKILSSRKNIKQIKNKSDFIYRSINQEKLEKFDQILKKMRNLVK